MAGALQALCLARRLRRVNKAMDDLDNSLLRLRETGLKATGPRMRVLEMFGRSERRHWKAEDVYQALLQAGADVGLATVYRVLNQLEQSGILRRSRLDPAHATYELAGGEHHDHLVCTHCGHIEEFHDPGIEQRQRQLARQRGFELVEHSLALYGRCRRPGCSGRGDPTSDESR